MVFLVVVLACFSAQHLYSCCMLKVVVMAAFPIKFVLPRKILGLTQHAHGRKYRYAFVRLSPDLDESFVGKNVRITVEVLP